VRYASAEGLGQAFSFDLLESPWDAAHFTEIIRRNLELAEESGSSSTWVYSNHDVVRHATRYMPSGADGLDSARAQRVGLDRARAATMLALALPGCTYIYQGEELGLPQVRDIPREAWQDPLALRGGPSILESRDGCRVPLPWIHDAPFFGFSTSAAHLPQPEWFREYAADVESQDDDSTLRLYRDALKVRRELTEAGPLTWEDFGPGVIAFRRGARWMSITNFGDTPLELPAGHVALTSRPFDDRALPPNVTAWIAQDWR
jgi:alpha-glucosidase